MMRSDVRVRPIAGTCSACGASCVAVIQDGRTAALAVVCLHCDMPADRPEPMPTADRPTGRCACGNLLTIADRGRRCRQCVLEGGTL